MKMCPRSMCLAKKSHNMQSAKPLVSQHSKQGPSGPLQDEGNKSVCRQIDFTECLWRQIAVYGTFCKHLRAYVWTVDGFTALCWRDMTNFRGHFYLLAMDNKGGGYCKGGDDLWVFRYLSNGLCLQAKWNLKSSVINKNLKRPPLLMMTKNS